MSFITPDLRRGGAERNVVTLATSLDPDRFRVSVICIKDRGPLFRQIVAQGIPAFALEASTRTDYAPAFLRLLRVLRRERPAVVITHGLVASVLGRVAGAVSGVPVRIAWKHNCGHLGRHGLVDRWSERLLAPITDLYIGVAYGQVPYLLGFLGLPAAKVRIVRNSVDGFALAAHPGPAGEAQDRSLRLEAGDRVVAIPAVLREEKDHSTLLRAMPDVLRQVPRARLLIIGDGPERTALERLARRLDVSRQVRFLGDRGDAVELLRHVDLVVLSSFTIECFPYAILEAMAMKRPVVCTAVGGLPEMVEDGVTGYLVPPGNPGLLADRIVRALQSPDVGRAMGRAGRRRLDEQFSFRAMVAEAEHLIETVVARKLAQRLRSQSE